MTTDWGTGEAAAALHRDALVCDFTLPYTDYGDPQAKMALLPRFAAAGVDFVSLSVGGDGGSIQSTVRILAQERARMAAEPARYRLVDTVADIEHAKADGVLAVAFDLQGITPLEGDIAMVDVYYRLGVRHMLIAYNSRNAAGDGCMEPEDAGLSGFGRRLVAEMNRVGMLVDCSHTGRRTALETIAASTDPVIYSHANAAGLHPHPRNIDDAQIDACAASGGVIGVLGVSNMLNPEGDVSATRLVEHVDYIVQRVGPAHVGLSLDYVYDQPFIYGIALAAAGGAFPPGTGYRPDMPLTEPEDYPRITEALLARGYGEAAVRDILGRNWMRVAAQVWKPVA